MSRMTDSRIAELAARQYGLVASHQARAAGLTTAAIRHRLAHGRWFAIRRGVYLVSGVPRSREQAVLAACLAGGIDALASHRTAGELWALRGVEAAGIEIVTSGHLRPRLAGVVSHRTWTLPAHHRAVVRGIPVNSVARTRVDLSSTLSPGQLRRVVDDALRRRLLALGDLRRCHADLTIRVGGRCTRTVGLILQERLPGYDPGGSDPELRVARVLVGAGLPEPVQQHRVCVGRRTYRLDLAYPDAKVAIEYDGWDFHRTRSDFDADRARVNQLVGQGWAVLQFTSAFTDARIVEDVTRALTRALTSLSSLSSV